MHLIDVDTCSRKHASYNIVMLEYNISYAFNFQFHVDYEDDLSKCFQTQFIPKDK